VGADCFCNQFVTRRVVDVDNRNRKRAKANRDIPEDFNSMDAYIFFPDRLHVKDFWQKKF